MDPSQDPERRAAQRRANEQLELPFSESTRTDDVPSIASVQKEIKELKKKREAECDGDST